MPRITLCMIVRDEEAMLAGCLASVRGVADDMVVVDTGSRDATKQVARDAGARVFDFTWCDDFAAARNAALGHAHGEWILQLDGDERLTPESGPRIRSAVARAKFDCGLLRIHDAARVDAPLADVVSGRERQSEVQLVARLIRRTPDLKYVDAIHENVLPWVRKRGTKVAAVDADIVHLGATAQVVDSKKKVDRNVRLLRARIERDPTDLVAYGYLAHDYLRAGMLDEALEVADTGWQHAGLAKRRKISIHRLAIARAYLFIPRGRFGEIRETNEVARSIDGENPDFTYVDAYSWEVEARHTTGDEQRTAWIAARDGYRRCLAFGHRVFSTAFVFGASTWAGATRLGTVQMLLGETREALESFDAALAVRPTEREALLGRAEAMIDLGDASGALRRIEVLLDGSPDGWTLAAAAVSALGRDNDTELFARRAGALAGKGFVAPHRRERLRSLSASLV